MLFLIFVTQKLLILLIQIYSSLLVQMGILFSQTLSHNKNIKLIHLARPQWSEILLILSIYFLLTANQVMWCFKRYKLPLHENNPRSYLCFILVTLRVINTHNQWSRWHTMCMNNRKSLWCSYTITSIIKLFFLKFAWALVNFSTFDCCQGGTLISRLLNTRIVQFPII